MFRSRNLLRSSRKVFHFVSSLPPPPFPSSSRRTGTTFKESFFRLAWSSVPSEMERLTELFFWGFSMSSGIRYGGSFRRNSETRLEPLSLTIFHL